MKHYLGAISEAALGPLSSWVKAFEVTHLQRHVGCQSQSFSMPFHRGYLSRPQAESTLCQCGVVEGRVWHTWLIPALFPSPICRTYDAPAQQHREQHDTVVDTPRETQRHHS